MALYASDSFAYDGETEANNSRIKTPQYTPFLFDNAGRSAESSFEVYLAMGEEDSFRSHNYGFVLNRASIVEEWLNSKARTA